MPRTNWPNVSDRAAVWVRSQDVQVTLRQVFYWLVSNQMIGNTISSYKALSRVTAERRREGSFPALADSTRHISRLAHWTDAYDFRESVEPMFHLDRTEDQEHQVWVVVEKRGLLGQVWQWVGARGWPVVPLGGYGSQTIADDVAEEVSEDGRPAVLLYIGDFDASGVDIERDFVARTDCWDSVVRVALTREQVVERDLPLLPGKTSDARSARFAAVNGRLFQVEVDALDPTDLRDLLLAAGAPYWDESTWASVVAEENAIRAELWQ